MMWSHMARRRVRSFPFLGSFAGSFLASILAAVLATGCAGLPPASAPSAIDTATAPRRAFHDAIDIGGRLALRYEKDGREQAIDGKFTWTQEGARLLVTLLTPFGQTLATIDVTPQDAVLTQSGQPPRREPDVDLLTASALGWPLPIAGLRTWLQGFATDSAGQAYFATANASGDAAYVKTGDGWLLHYTTWESASADSPAPHPKRIDLQRMTAQAGNVALRIVIDQWQPH